MDENTKNVTITLEEYKDLITKCVDWDGIYAITAHVSDEKVAMEAIRCLMGVWKDDGN